MNKLFGAKFVNVYLGKKEKIHKKKIVVLVSLNFSDDIIVFC